MLGYQLGPPKSLIPYLPPFHGFTSFCRLIGFLLNSPFPSSFPPLWSSCSVACRSAFPLPPQVVVFCTHLFSTFPLFILLAFSGSFPFPLISRTPMNWSVLCSSPQCSPGPQTLASSYLTDSSSQKCLSKLSVSRSNARLICLSSSWEIYPRTQPDVHIVTRHPGFPSFLTSTSQQFTSPLVFSCNFTDQTFSIQPLSPPSCATAFSCP